jgi:hypothetical protein
MLKSLKIENFRCFSRFEMQQLGRLNLIVGTNNTTPNQNPGRQLHQAVMEKIFELTHPNAQKFVTWFKELYGL